MARYKTKKLKSETLYEEWLEGRNHRLKPGDVVRRKTGDQSIGVVQYALCEMETYQFKWWVGPQPWDVLEGPASSVHVTKTNEPNPTKYKWSQRVPGPSSVEIDRLEEIFAKRDKKVFTAKDADLNAALLEEELIKKKALSKIDESKVDSIVDSTLEEDVDIPLDDSVVDQKIKNILDEE